MLWLVIPTKPGTQKKTGFRIKSRMTNGIRLMPFRYKNIISDQIGIEEEKRDGLDGI
jgi:hypothetical protein